MIQKEIKDNDIFIITTDTIIGIAGKVNDVVKEKIYILKKRDKAKLLVIAISSIDQLKTIENLNDSHLKYIKKYWPGAITLIINDKAYRMPNNKLLLNFIEEIGPIYLTSCNISGEKVVDTLYEAKIKFPNLNVFDFGKGSGKASKIINTKNNKIIRN